MKKFGLFIITALCFLFISCASKPLDQGFYPIGEELETYAELFVGPDIIINAIDKGMDPTYHPFPSTIKGWKIKFHPSQEQVVRLSPGVHVVNVMYQSTEYYTSSVNSLIVNLEQDKQYKITSQINNNYIFFDCINLDTNESIKLDLSALKGNSESTISAFIASVLNPTMDNIGKTVIQENEDFIIYSYPNLKFKLIDKKTGKIETGMRTFVTEFPLQTGTVYLYVTDMTDKDEFLNSDFKNNSQYVLSITACDRKTVTYKYQKPFDKKDTNITFNISVQQ